MTSAVREVLLCYGYLSCKQASTEETTGVVPIALTSIMYVRTHGSGVCLCRLSRAEDKICTLDLRI